MIQKTLSIRLFLCLIIFVGFLSGCALSFQPKESENSHIEDELPSAVTEPELVTISFVAHSYQRFSEEDEIALDILDLVSGVSYNLVRYPLIQNGNEYQLSVELPQGATISYRYTLTHPIEVGETLPEGGALPFRQLVVRENLVVNDTIAGWPELAYNGPLVDLNGAVADDETEAPLADVLVNVAGKTALTDMNGRFFIRGLPVGKHNMVAITNDGSYLSFQQEVNMVENLATLAIVRMTPLPEVTLTIVMTPPNEAVGAPVRVAGNLSQFGQTYYDMLLGKGVQAVNMPIMARNPDGKYVTQINLFAGSFVQYQYTMGDAVVNNERNLEGNRIVRQFVVPDKNVLIDDSVTTWRAQQQSAISIFVTTPDDATSADQVYIQFNSGTWSNPIPMWPMDNNQWMLVYNPRITNGESVVYRYCRNADCKLGEEIYPNSTPRSITVGTNAEIRDTIAAWRLWDPALESDSTFSPVSFNDEALVGVEIDPNFVLNNTNATFGMIDQLNSRGFNWIILTPSWKVGINKDLPFIDSDPLTTIPSTELNQLAMKARESGLKVAIYPHLIFPSDGISWWDNSLKSMIWWQQWYADYERMVMHTIKLATTIKADQIILGGPDVSKTYPGAMETVGENFGTPKTSEKIWTDLLTKVDEYYEGQILLAHQVDSESLENYSFYSLAQGFYLLLNADLNNSVTYIDEAVNRYFDSILLAFQQTQQKPIYVGLNGASFQTASQGANGDSSLLISSTNVTYESHNVDIDFQTQFYSVYLNAISSRDWISGVASRGFYPALQLTDFSSSIYGKPALNLFHNN